MAGPCCEFTGADIGNSVPIITIISGTAAVSGVVITADPCAGFSDTYSDTYDDCAEGGSMTYAEYALDDVPAGHTLIIDAHERTVRLFESSTNQIVGGMDALSFLGLFDWIEAAGGCCARICANTDGATINAETTITVDVHDREL